ncbi:MAG: CoB--CoM heterodisulfide reductase iron-sulfur subunit B family protein [Desulfobacterales bacterium]|nr:CoB--CoM heterodisulfide reductase iron-sulfur subunit B family protein [Desulfobacterales bacterium]
MSYLYYPGCSLEGTGRDCQESFFAVCSALNIDIEELDEWQCCGSSVAKSFDKELAEALPSKTLINANKQNPDSDLVMLCPACSLNHQLRILEARDEASLKNELSISRVPEVKQFIEVLAFDTNAEDVKEKLTISLRGIRALPYYGCLIARPRKLHGTESHERPTVLEDLIRLTGADPIDFTYKTDCCGGTLILSREKIALRMCGELLKEAKAAKPDCIVVSCPLCHLILDAKQKVVEKEIGEKIGIPVLYITQLLGIAMGLNDKDLGIQRLVTPPKGLLNKINKNSVRNPI